MVNRLVFVARESSEHGRHFWEPFVDGHPLRQILAGTSGDGGADAVVGDKIPVLVHNWPTGLPNDVFVLLGEQPPELPSGRIPIFVCPVCGDLGCGAVTAEVEWTADTVIWREFGWDVNYETGEDDGDDRLRVGPFEFDREQYETELRRFIDTFDDVRGSLSAHLLPSMGGEGVRPARRRRSWPFN